MGSLGSGPHNFVMAPSTRTARSSRPRTAGFTLIELMIAVVIAAILAAVAFPAYLGSIRKGRRAEAVSALTAIQQAQERWRANNAQYAAYLTAPPAGLGFSSTTPSGYYDVEIEPLTADASNYVLKATARAGTSQANDSNCLIMRLQLSAGTVSYGGCASCGTPTPSALATDPDRCWVR